MKNFLPWVLVIGFLAVLVLFLVNKQDTFADIKYIKIGKVVLDVELAIPPLEIAGAVLNIELAITPQAKIQGLSGRRELKENEGMLFVFDYPRKYTFWMKDMNFPIDIIWIGEDLRVVYIKKNALPQLYPETYTPDVDAKYVLETVSGFSEKNNIKEGDGVEFARASN